jgi:hypothetical protein
MATSLRSMLHSHLGNRGLVPRSVEGKGMRNTMWVGHLACEVETDLRADQWLLHVSNNGVYLGLSYGPLPIPDKATLEHKAQYVANNLPKNIWG